MQYPSLQNTPIKEIIFSISYEEIVDNNCFEKFVALEPIKKRFPIQRPSIAIEFTSNSGVSEQKNYRLKNDTEVLQLRKGSLSYHYLNQYNSFDVMTDNTIKFWNAFDELVKEDLTISAVSVRYINEIHIDADNPESRLVQLYPKHSSDRNIKNFQNSVSFSYKNQSEYQIHVVSTKPTQDRVLLDITVINPIQEGEKVNLENFFTPLRDVKNRVFFDSITAQALLRYINQT